MVKNDLSDEYFEWLCGIVCKNRFSKQVSFRELLTHLHSIEFRYLLANDGNWADDCIARRYRFAEDMGGQLEGPCTVLELLVEVALYCEKHIMDDMDVGDRTSQWFWGMIANLGLGSMYNTRYDPDYVNEVVERFLDRDYEPNGKGGLFTIRNCDRDLRGVTIYHQLCWYLNSIT